MTLRNVTLLINLVLHNAHAHTHLSHGLGINERKEAAVRFHWKNRIKLLINISQTNKVTLPRDTHTHTHFKACVHFLHATCDHLRKTHTNTFMIGLKSLSLHKDKIPHPGALIMGM